MSLKRTGLICAISCVLICCVNQFKIRIVFAIGLGLLSLTFLNKKERVTYTFVLMLLVICSYPFNVSFSTGKVCMVKNNYYVVSNRLYSYIVYGNSAIIGDEVTALANLEEIHSNSNFENSTFESYCKGNNIIGSIDEKYVEIVHKNTFFSINYLKNISNNNLWINQILYSQGLSINIDSVIVSCSMQISFVVYFVKSFFNLFMYEKRAKQIALFISILLCIFSQFNYGAVRITLWMILDISIKDKKEKLSWFIILMCLYRPYYVKSLAFMIPIGIRICNFSSKYKNTLCITLYIVLIQLYFNGYCNIVEVLSFNLLRNIYGLMYLFAVILNGSILKLSFNGFVTFLYEITNSFPKIELTGSISILMIFISIYFIRNIQQYNQKRFWIYLLFILFINQYERLFYPFYTITYLDVGQGDSALITFPFCQEGLLIDTGGNVYKDIATTVLIPYLKRESIKNVSIIISHEDYDHSGALESLRGNFTTNQIIMDKFEYINFHNLEIYDPLFQFVYSDVNDNSLLCYFSIRQFYFLFLGDASEKVESDLVDEYGLLEIDFLKLSHHGSSTATSDKLLRNYSIPFSVISVGYKNKYGHPTSEVVDRLDKYNCHYFRTDVQGAIKLYIFNHIILYKTSNGQVGCYIK